MKEVDPDKKVSEQLGFEVKHRNAALAKATARDYLLQTDLADFFAGVRDQVVA